VKQQLLLLFLSDTRLSFVSSLATAFAAVEFWTVKTGGTFLFLREILPSLSGGSVSPMHL